MSLVGEAFARLRRPGGGAAVWVSVDATQGSAPREAGTWMAVFADTVVGTIGGGNVEYQAIDLARARLLATDGGGGEAVIRFPLGPGLGQCCGGVMLLRFERVDASELPMLERRFARVLTPVALFGGGHVGAALVDVLGRLPCAVHWIDSRDGVFPAAVPENVRCEHSGPVQAAVADLAPGSHVLIMSFSHAEDLDVVAACLRRQRDRSDLAHIGLIGSQTKWATFRHRLAARGFSAHEVAAVNCPIGLPGIVGKEPEVIAVSVAAQLLQLRSASHRT